MIAHPIPYQGSKRRLAGQILRYAPTPIQTLYEPFAGSAAITLAAAASGRARRYVLGDRLQPLIELWNEVLERPHELATAYTDLWHAQHHDPRAFFEQVRSDYNQSAGSARLLYLLARCVKNAVRFNAAGAFNQSADHRRLGTKPERMKRHILLAHQHLKGRTRAVATDFSETLASAKPGDLVYLDPPYQGTSQGKDRRYVASLARERLIGELERLRSRGVATIVSYDGSTGTRRYGTPLPAELGLRRIELKAGWSSQATLNGRRAQTVESLYLSPEVAP